MAQFKKACIKLAELEDKLEAGTLVEVSHDTAMLKHEKHNEAVKEFAEKLKSHIILNYTMDGEFVEDINIWSLFKDIENLIEEVEK